MNTLVEISTDEGLSGLGSCFTSQALVEGSLALLRPLLIGETGLEAERVSEKLRQSTFWQGRGGAVEHAISGLDIALGFARQSPESAGVAPAGRKLSNSDQTLRFHSLRRAGLLRDKLERQIQRGFRAVKMGWRPFGRVSRKLDELLIATARNTVGDDVELMVDAGGSEQFWPHGVTWARETARMLGDFRSPGLKKPCVPTTWRVIGSCGKRRR